MYSTCLFCNHDLGSNQALERFPIGRRIAFDGATGRLWVVCRKCERWNLSALEERWEVIEDCERFFSSTRMRVSTENIGLARIAEGLELVRIGRPLRPEFAAWRYGDQFGRRRRRNIVRVGAGVGAAGLIVSGMWAAGMAVGGGLNIGINVLRPLVFGMPFKVVAQVSAGDHPIKVKRGHLQKVRILADSNDWFLQVPDGTGIATLRGEHAQRAAALLLPHVNRAGGTKQDVSDAVGLLDREADPMQFVSTIARRKHERGFIQAMPAAIRLAMEMASHEDAERRALEGELKALEIAWKEAEEIAAISDSLFTPDSVLEKIDRFKRG